MGYVLFNGLFIVAMDQGDEWNEFGGKLDQFIQISEEICTTVVSYSRTEVSFMVLEVMIIEYF